MDPQAEHKLRGFSLTNTLQYYIKTQQPTPHPVKQTTQFQSDQKQKHSVTLTYDVNVFCFLESKTEIVIRT